MADRTAGDVTSAVLDHLPAGEFVTDHGGDLLETATAVFDPSRRYRYLLTRTWSTAPPLVMCLTNPSIADAFITDPTATRAVKLARREQAGGLVILNAFALCATDPAALRIAADPIGPHNDAMLAWVAGWGGDVVVGWGIHGALLDRGRQLARRLAAVDARLRCLGTTKAGQPRHPLFTRADTPLVPFEPTAIAA